METTEQHLTDLVAVPAELVANLEPIPAETIEPGVVEVELTDENVIAVHFRHVNDIEATISASIDRAGALALAEVLRAAAARPA